MKKKKKNLLRQAKEAMQKIRGANPKQFLHKLMLNKYSCLEKLPYPTLP